MARTTEAAVRKILATKLATEVLTAFIDDASLWVTETVAPHGGLSPERLELIERYLAAALARLRDLGLKAASMTDVSESYQVHPDITDYLLRAAGFDSTGEVANAFLGDTVPGMKRARARVGAGFTRKHTGSF